MSYFSILKKHGLKILLSNFLGNLAVSFGISIPIVILVVVGMILIGATAGPLTGLNENMTEEELLQEMGQVYLPPGTVIAISIIALLFFILILLSTAFQTAGSIAVTAEAAAFNRSDIGTYFKKGFKFTGKMFLLLLLSSLLYAAVFLLGVISILLFSTENAGGIILGILLILAALALSVILGLALMHAPVILLTENTSATQAISKSYYLFKKAFGRVFGSAFYSFLIGMGAFIAFFIVLFILSLIVNAISPNGEVEGVAGIFFVLGNLVVLVISWIGQPLITTLTLLLIIYRYFKYMRHWINPNAHGEEPSLAGNQPGANFTPSFSFKPNAGPSGQQPNHSATSEDFRWDADVPPENRE